MAPGRGLTALALMLAACGVVPEAPPTGPLALAEAGLEWREGRLALSHWPAEGGRPWAVILGVHGFGFYGESAFLTAGPFWAARGVEVYAYDQRGFGRNADRLDWPGEAGLIGDLEEAARAVKARHPGLPLFVVGHSMGGGVALAAAGEGRLPEAAGIVALAPAVWGGDTLPLPMRAAAWAAAGLLPEKRWTGAGVVEIRPTDNLELLRAIVRDPLHVAAPSSREMFGLVRLMDRAVAALPGVRQPALVVVGAHDEVVPAAPIRQAYEGLGGPKDFVRVATGWHMLLHDLAAERVHALVTGWMAEVLRERA
ncbi:MAG TPA: alpha/beta fold hydrolase [Paracoccaceae bacterium]|nr:alpha/beta fold hydrolase [Paracoccaceae bacterium]